jgi:hypothetical protein
VPAFEKFNIEAFNMNETQFWPFMKIYMEHKIDKKQLNSYYDYDLLTKN